MFVIFEKKGKFPRNFKTTNDLEDKLGWKGRVLTLSFNARIKTWMEDPSEDPKVQKWSNKA